MGKSLVTATAISILAVGLAACGEPPRPTATPKVGVILPEVESVRIEADRRYLAEAFEDAGIDYDIESPQGNIEQLHAAGDSLIEGGATVLIVFALDRDSGQALLERARQAGVTTIDFDRPTPGGGADYYVGFDHAAAGPMQAEGVIRCLTEASVPTPVVAYLNGSPTDRLATVLRDGYDSVLAPLFASGSYVKGPDDFVPDWDGMQAEAIFAQQWTDADGHIDAVLAANDNLANAAISVLRRHGRAGQVPVTGMDAGVYGLQNILRGDQCMSVYWPAEQEAAAAAALAIALARGLTPDGLSAISDVDTDRTVPARLVPPVPIFKDNVADAWDGVLTSREQVCVDEFEALCVEAGI